MSKGRRTREQNKQKKRRRRRERSERKGRAAPNKRLTPKLGDRIDAAYDLISQGEFAEAEALLDHLNKRYDRYAALIEAQLFFYRTTENHPRCCQAAKRLMTLTPRDPDARLIYAQESMLCGRVGIALANYRLFLERWPDHGNAPKAMNAIELVEPECAARCQDVGLGDSGLELLVMHDEVLECVEAGRFQDAAEKCLELLQQAPDCMSARNNLALAYYQSGKVEKAVQVCETTCRLSPNNRFAEATLGKFRFLTGDEAEANAIADRIVVNPPTQQDALAAVIEMLSFLGRDEDIVVVSQAARDQGDRDPRCQSLLLHHLAVAQCRLGDEKAARASWKKCLKAMPSHPEARGNLDDLDCGGGHAPWPESTAKWVPQAVFQDAADRSVASKDGQLNLERDYPAIAAVIPALLDRGDPGGRKMAMRIAIADGSPAMLDALHQFASSSRGPDTMRYEALQTLGRAGVVDSGPHRFFSRGSWSEVKLFMAEITWQQTTPATPRVQELAEEGTEALRNGDLALAEESFNRILEIDPDNCTAAYNLCLVWLRRDGGAGRRRVRACMEELQERFPDYLFAPICLAQFASIDGDFDRAARLLDPIFNARRLHISEAMALFATQVQIAIERRDLGAAEQAMSWLTLIADEDDRFVGASTPLEPNAGRVDCWGLRDVWPGSSLKRQFPRQNRDGSCCRQGIV